MKELLLLLRDRTGLLVLFFMPAVLVVVVSLVQENILKSTGETTLEILFVDQDRQMFSKTIREQLEASGAITLITPSADQVTDSRQVESLIRKGHYPACVVIPPGTTDAIRKLAIDQISDAFSASSRMDTFPLPRLSVYFDALVQGSFRSAIINALNQIALTLELEIKAKVLSEFLPIQMDTLSGGQSPGEIGMSLVTLDDSWGKRRLMDVVTEKSQMKQMPTSVQHNVPAWAVFGMFFIVLPLGGGIIRERQDGTLIRLKMLPVPYLTLLFGKLMAYVIVCWGQFLFIVIVGKQVLPQLGTPVLTMGSDVMTLVIAVTCIALAACGYGVMLGTLGRSFEQISMFGPVSVVCAAALGGIMVPVYVMPQSMQTISLFSPLAWGLNALVEIFVRDGTLLSILPELGYLLAFSATTLTVAWALFSRH